MSDMVKVLKELGSDRDVKPECLMPKLDQKRVQEAIDRAYDAEVANLFKTLIENLMEASTGASSGGFTKADQCVGAFARSMKQAAFAYEKACAVAEQMATTTDAS